MVEGNSNGGGVDEKTNSKDGDMDDQANSNDGGMDEPANSNYCGMDQQTNSNDVGMYEPANLSVRKQRILLLVLLSVQFLTLSVDTVLLPFFPHEGLLKGLTPTTIGIVFAVYELSRFIFSPIFGSMVS